MQQKIAADKITRPIQLLAAWLAGLVLVDGLFLGTAVSITGADWIKAILVIASILNVPIFLGCLFLLQTKFRPEMQEDSYYSKYLESNTGKIVSATSVDSEIRQLRIEIVESSQRSVALIPELENGLKSISRYLDTGSAVSTTQLEMKADVRSVEEAVDRSAKAITLAKLHIVEPILAVEINDMLPAYHKIRRELKAQGISIDKTFGSTSEIPEIPKQQIIGFGSKVPIDVLRSIVATLRKFGFDRIHYTDKIYSEGRIYIGSYIYRAPELPQPVPITDAIIGVLDAPDGTLEDLIENIELARA